MLKTELEGFHLLDAEEQIPQGPDYKYRRMYVNRTAQNFIHTAIIWTNV